MDRSAVFNNAGVCFCQAGKLDVAQDMFLAALEETLLFARDDDEPNDHDHVEQEQENDENSMQASAAAASFSLQQQQQQQQQRITPPCVITAETHLANMEAILASTTVPNSTTTATASTGMSARDSFSEQEEEEEVSSENIPPAPNQQLDDENDENSSSSASSSSNMHHHPRDRATTAYLYMEPISLQAVPVAAAVDNRNNNMSSSSSQENSCPFSSSSSPIQLIGAVVVFNLALVHHLRNASSTKARQFYQIAEALMQDGLQALGGGGGEQDHNMNVEGRDDSSDGSSAEGMSDAYRCTLLQVALTNNMGVWWYQNGHVTEASESLQRLIAMSSAFGPILPRTVQDGLNANIRQVQSRLLVLPSSGAAAKTLTPAW